MKKLFPLMLLLAFISCKKEVLNPADTIYFGGDILTMEGEKPIYAEAVAVKKGKIIFVGKKAEAEKFDGNETKMIDLQGKTLLPGFIDAHGHVWNAGFQAVSANLLPAPDGTANDIPTIISLLNEWKTKNPKAVGKYGWIIGFGYDDAQLKEKLPPTADDLDKVSSTVPVLIIHQSGHLAVMNHKALELAGYSAATKDPAGGVIRRKENSQEPNGVLEEMAMFIPLFKMMGTLDTLANEKIAEAGIAAYTKFGFTTAQEGRASSDACNTWSKLANEGKLSIDIAAYPDIQTQMEYLKAHGVQKNYTNHFRIAGVKLSLDGSPQGKTAWLTQPYKVPPPGKPNTYLGYPAFPKESDAIALVDSAYANNYQILAHCNGDAAVDEYLTAIEHAEKLYGRKDRRPVAIHAQTARFDQLDKMKTLGIMPSFFGMHTYYWGDWHRDEILGKERAYRISPAATALKKGMIFTQHHDAPVALPNSIMILYSVVNRISRSGDVIGPEERISTYDALRSITTWAAYQYFEENSKGSIKTEKLADFVILDKNPLKVASEKIIDIQVLETIKEGKSIYKK
ncbi:amidohydrolase family protein [Flavobacterium sp. GA093]|uniref:Amidohydrolase family protein n=1 Tax=Flavobacterium hydrocarbonoxydans TaxID=2683249 RepID=A0A6I4NLJ8_9FLAO|nr:amidohydrolase [Flavobacterium hydrocarbonoxydans]MWB95230.1 amidohydrolase family protein [Flavobacterium hydrocarbonoxydans]